MSILKLDISGFRNIVSTKTELSSEGFNLLVGNNGSGKTSFLEAVYYLSLGRSFRSATNSPLIHHASDRFAMHSSIMMPNQQQKISAGIERLRGGDFTVRLGGKDVDSIAEIAHLLPVQLINSNCYSLLDSGPSFRRKYLDWGVFYHTKEFLPIWRQYRKALKQRNAGLGLKVSRRELNAWDDEIVQYALLLHQMRQEYLDKLIPLLNELVSNLLSLENLSIRYYPGWDEGIAYRDILERSISKDMHIGYTQYGPHRANLDIAINKHAAKDILSRGQQKLFVCAMILAQGALLNMSRNKRPIYLVDDLPSELDLTSRSNLIALLSKQEAQVFVTTVENNVFDGCSITKPVKLFHVEHGNLMQI